MPCNLCSKRVHDPFHCHIRRGKYLLSAPLKSYQRQRDGGGGHDVINRRTPAEVTNRLAKPLQERAYSLRTGKFLCQFVRDIAGIKRRKDQNIGIDRIGL